MRDGGVNGQPRRRFCHSEVPPPYLSVSRRLWVGFRSDFSVTFKGFHAAYHTGACVMHSMLGLCFTFLFSRRQILCGLCLL